MLIVADGVGHRYNQVERPVLQSVHLRVAAGESLGIMGPSGSGKSTLLAILGHLLRPSEGSVRLELGDRAGAPPGLGGAVFAWVTQGGNLLGHRTAVDNVALATLGGGTTMPVGRQLARRLLGEMGMGDRVAVAAKRLSGGEAQRVGIARALATGRPVLLADEPTAQLDRATADHVVARLVEASRSRVLIVVTHDPLVACLLDRVVYLADGRIREEPSGVAAP